MNDPDNKLLEQIAQEMAMQNPCATPREIREMVMEELKSRTDKDEANTDG